MGQEQPSAEYVSTDWKELTAVSKTKINLIEAKLHVAYAQIYQDTTEEVEKVKSEIDEADWYLKKAEQHVDDPTQAKLDAIGQELKEAKARLEVKGLDVRARYEKINERPSLCGGVNARRKNSDGGGRSERPNKAASGENRGVNK